MDEKQLKTSLWQRIVIIIVAILLLGSTVLAYMFIVMSGNSANQDREARIAELEAQYTAKSEEIQAAGEALSPQYFDTMKEYLKQVKSFNAATANNEKLKITDLKTGTGRQLGEEDYDYLAYYIGWCPDGSILDSSFNYAEDDTDKTTPISLKAPLDASMINLIEGWNQGVVGMKLGGVRQISIPGELAYKDIEKCGMTDAPIRYAVMTIEPNEEIKTLRTELNDIYAKLYTAILGNQ